ncbi:Zinc finger protein [Sarcoptes scabiei]|uniref:Zinc finger protein n=2 Tax=Sarcoptes scabiei TaxID=52283 RepID=A0A834R6K2_SARSC|nr:Zinc finger protein [Sarcoptes scabiei]
MTTLAKISNSSSMNAPATDYDLYNFNDIDQRHHKLLQNIVKILKINNVLEEYRLVVRNIQQQCCCKRTRNYWDRLSILESKYKELIVDSGRTSTSSSIGKSSIVQQSFINNDDDCFVDEPYPTSHQYSMETNIDAPNKKMKLRGSMKMMAFNDNSNSLLSKDANQYQHIQNSNDSIPNQVSSATDHGSTNENANLMTQLMVLDENDDVNLIEEEEILEDEEDDDAEEELDIEEFMALSEILEKEGGQNKFEKELDSKNEFILVIKDINSKEIICYECTVGGACGFLSRERTRMVYHIAKHYQQTVEDEEEEDEDEEEEEVSILQSRLQSGKDVDISIIPVSTDSIQTNLVSNNNSEPIVIIKEDTISNQGIIGLSKSRSSVDMLNSTSKYLNQQSQRQMNSSINTSSKMNIANNNNTSNSINSQPSPTTYSRISSSNQSNKQQPPVNKPIKCEWENCVFMCDQNYKLRTHIRQVHEKVRPYLCDWPGCFGAYKTRSNLASHRMVHTGERPFICDHPKCGAKFARKYDCERHRRIHSEKMYPCEWPGCGKRLCDPYNLERHMMVHKGELPFRCPIVNCVRGFRELRYLRDHMVNTHKFLPDTNQLRMACSNSSKMVSIIGYNLKESGGVTSNNGSNASGSFMAINNNNVSNDSVVTTPITTLITKNSSQVTSGSTNSSNKSTTSEGIKKESPSPSSSVQSSNSLTSSVVNPTKKSNSETIQSSSVGNVGNLIPQRTISTRSTPIKVQDIIDDSKNEDSNTEDNEDEEKTEKESSSLATSLQTSQTSKRSKRIRS